MKPKPGPYYTCPNSGLVIQISRIRYANEDYTKANIRYFCKASGRLLTEERNVKLIHKNIQHWYRTEL